jgi:hypothetical protein
MYKNNIFKRDTSVREDTNQGRGMKNSFITCSISGLNFDPYEFEKNTKIKLNTKYKIGELSDIKGIYKDNIMPEGFGNFSKELNSTFSLHYLLSKIDKYLYNSIKNGEVEIDLTLHLCYIKNNQNNYSVSLEEINLLNKLKLFLNITIV